MKSTKYRAVISSTHIDRHGDVMTKEALEQMVETINNERVRIRMGVDHRRDFPPMGRVENGELVEKDGHYFVEADYVTYEKSTNVPWNPSLRMEYSDTVFRFTEVDDQEASGISVSIDPQNFNSYKEVLDFSKELKLKTDLIFSVQHHGRKSLIPDPEVIFGLTKSFLLYHLLKPTAKKIGDKVSERISKAAVKEGEKATEFVVNTLKEVFFRCIPKSRPVAVIFDIPGQPHIELIARTRDEKLILKGLSRKRMSEMQKEIEDVTNNVQVAKIQFILNDKGKWKFNYLITDTGAAIGTKIAFERRDRRYKLMGTEKAKKLKKKFK